MVFGLSKHYIIVAIVLPILLAALLTDLQGQSPSVVTEDYLLEETDTGLELIQKKAIKTVSSPSKRIGKITNLPDSVDSAEPLEMDTRTERDEQDTLATAVKIDSVARARKGAEVIKNHARANETQDSCATCYNGQHDGVCISNPEYDGACTNPSGTIYCRLGSSFGTFPVDSCGAPPQQQENNCSSCYNSEHDGPCISNPNYQGRCTDPSGSVYCQLGGPRGRFPVDTCSFAQGYCGSCYNGDNNGPCISNPQFGGACTDPTGSNYCQLGGPRGAYPVSSCPLPSTPAPTTTTTTTMKVTTTTTEMAKEECVDFCAGFASDAGWSTTCKEAGHQCAACKDCKEIKEGGGNDVPSSGGDFSGGLDLLAADLLAAQR